MNMTGDPNQRNKPAMFGFDSSFLNPTLNLPQTNDGVVTVNGPIPTRTHPISDSIPPVVNNHVPFAASNFAFPSTSSLNFSPSTDRYIFPFPQNATSTQVFGGTSEASGSRQSTNPFLGSQFNWPSLTPFSREIVVKPSTSNNVTSKPLSSMFGCKRKTESPPLPPTKQHITEERMAEHMSRLHISSQTPTSSTESEPVRERRLYMCEEMQRLQTESIIPAQILERVNRPCTALVPWRPPIVPPIFKENNNNDEETDNNLMLEENTLDSTTVDMMES